MRVGGDMALMQALSSRRLLDADDGSYGSALDHAFLDEHTKGLAEFRTHLSGLSEDDVLEATGVRAEEIDELAQKYIKSPGRAPSCVGRWAWTQHKHAVATIREIVNLLLLRGNIGKPGAGACPIRGHSNVQGDRTMGIWEKPRPEFIDGLEREFGIPFPREHGARTWWSRYVGCATARSRSSSQWAEISRPLTSDSEP